MRVRGQKDGYGGGAALTKAFYLFVDSESFAINPNIKENTSKIVQGRAVLEQARTIEGREPGGQFTFQPRSDDVLGLAAAHFQAYRSDITGTVSTFTFFPLAQQPDWSGTLVTGGDPWDAGGVGTATYNDGETTDVCALMVEQYYGQTRDGSNGRRFTDCVVSDLEFSASVGEELQISPTLKAGSFALVDFTPATDDPDCAIGSYSTLGAFRYYEGTLTVNGASYDVNSFRVTSSNNVDSKKVIGKLNPASYPYGRYVASGEFELEMGYGSFVKEFLAEADGTFVATFLRGEEKLTITCPLVRYNEPTSNVSDGESLVNQTVPFVAYGRSANRSMAPLELEVTTTNELMGGSAFFPL